MNRILRLAATTALAAALLGATASTQPLAPQAIAAPSGATVTTVAAKSTAQTTAKTTARTTAATKKAKLPKACRTVARAMCADKRTDKLHYVRKGVVVKTMDARFGCWATRTREGTFSVGWKSRHHVSTLYHTPMPYAMFFSGGQAVHYSSDFAARGYAGCSHGCINIRDKAGIRWLFDQIKVGDRVVVYRS